MFYDFIELDIFTRFSVRSHSRILIEILCIFSRLGGKIVNEVSILLVAPSRVVQE